MRAKYISTRSFPFLWDVDSVGYRWNTAEALEPAPGYYHSCERYIDDQPPWIVPEGSKKRKYSLAFQDSELISVFVELRESDIIEFAKEYGLLGIPIELVPSRSGHADVVKGESLLRWNVEMGKLGSLMELWELVKARKTRVADYIIWSPTGKSVSLQMSWYWNEEDRGWYISNYSKRNQDKASISTVIAELHSSINPELLDHLEVGDPFGPAHFYIIDSINKRLKGNVTPQILPFYDNKIHIFPHTLLDSLWLMFLWSITGETRLARCPGCGRWFTPRDSRQKCHDNTCRQRYRRKKDLYPSIVGRKSL